MNERHGIIEDKLTETSLIIGKIGTIIKLIDQLVWEEDIKENMDDLKNSYEILSENYKTLKENFSELDKLLKDNLS